MARAIIRENQPSPVLFNGQPIEDCRFRLLAQRKLILLVDLDQTLVHTADEPLDTELEGIHRYRLSGDQDWMHTRIRPGTEEFLENVSHLFEMHVVTFGDRPYADKVVSLLDPTGRYFGSRVLSRDDSVNQFIKSANLRWMFPFGDEMVCMIDDRKDVWNYAANLVAVKPYVFFKDIGDIHAPAKMVPGISSSIDTDDDYLFFLEGTLREIHGRFFEEVDQSGTLPDLKQIVPSVQGLPLKGAVIAFSGCFPKKLCLDSFDICSLAMSLGAEIREELTDEVTHLIAARPDTRKARKAFKLGTISIVSEGWLWRSAEMRKRAPEGDFLVTPTEEMIARSDAKREAKIERRERRKASKRERREALDFHPETDQGSTESIEEASVGLKIPYDGEVGVDSCPLKKPKCDQEIEVIMDSKRC